MTTSIKLPVNEIFETIQGEAAYTGTPSVFLRLQGCDVGCPWCDTKHTWALDPAHEVDDQQMILKPGDGRQWASVEISDIVKYIAGLKSRHVVITGGEPATYDLSMLTAELLACDKSVQIETSGTYPIKVHHDTWVTVSPKIDMPGGRKVIAEELRGADEIKMPVGRMADIDLLKETIGKCFPRGHHPEVHPMIWLQPLSMSAKATALCIDEARANGWRVSLQVHKFAHMR